MEYVQGIYDDCPECQGGAVAPHRAHGIGSEATRATYRCTSCGHRWNTAWRVSIQASESPTSGMPALSGSRIVAPDGTYDYWCDLEEHDVEWWIAHLSEKNWWNPAWAARMRELAREVIA